MNHVDFAEVLFAAEKVRENEGRLCDISSIGSAFSRLRYHFRPHFESRTESVFSWRIEVSILLLLHFQSYQTVRFSYDPGKTEAFFH